MSTKTVRKKKKVKPIPKGYEGAVPYLCVKDGAAAIEFYKKALGATETMRLTQHDGRVGHAELKIGKAIIMMADEFPEFGTVSPKSVGGSPVTVQMYVEDVDAFTGRAVRAGMRVVRPVADQFYGDRGGKFEDPYGHMWWFSTHKEDVSLEEMKKRAAALFSSRGAKAASA
jgi:PhnB protein